jgi:hypothetical protein
MASKNLPIPPEHRITFEKIVEEAKRDAEIEDAPGLSMWYVRRLAAGEYVNPQTLGIMVARSRAPLPYSLYMYLGAFASGEISMPKGAPKKDPFEDWARQNLVVATYEELVCERGIPSRHERRTRTAYEWVVEQIAVECGEKPGTVRDMLEGKKRWPRPKLTPMPKHGEESRD